MNDREIRRHERATRVQAFGREYAADSAPGSKAATLFADLDPIVEKLNQARVGQIRTPLTKQVLIEALYLDFKDIARTARAIFLEDAAFPAGAYRVPEDYTEVAATTHSDQLLGLLEDKTRPGGDTPEQLAAMAALRAKFIAYELPADFVEDLRADRDAIDDANQDKHSDNFEGLQSTAAIGTLLEQARGIVTRLDAIMHNKYSRDPDKLRAWKSASRVERDPRKTKEEVDATTTPPP